jgi:DNA-binding CsgD family transcriptional regulator
MGFPPHSLPPSKLADLLAAERNGAPFLAYKDEPGELRLKTLDDVERITIGRSAQNGLALTWDPEVSRTHAQLERVGGDWTLVDEGLSRNGSFVNGERVGGRRRLDDGDMLRIGRTSVLFRCPGVVSNTTVVGDQAGLVRISEAQRRVLVALCRPLAEPGGAGVPAGNRQIAEELYLSQNGVKTHIRRLFAKLGIDDLPQYRKRTELAHRALDLGLVARRDFDS